jgi:hypothetical protein
MAQPDYRHTTTNIDVHFDPPGKPFRNAAMGRAIGLGDKLLRNPITGIASCCARAASGHAAAAPPSVAKNFRRSIWLAM